MTQSEVPGADDVFPVAFLAFVAAAVAAPLTLLSLLFRSGLLGRRD